VSGVSDRMPDSIDVFSFFDAVVQQDAERLRAFFEPDATIVWANTNEAFTVDEYVRVNCEYPGKWQCHIEDVQCYSRFHDYNRITAVVKVWDGDGNVARVISFIELGDTENELIQTLTEYWGDVGEPPEWRQKLGVGKRYQDEI
jgi:hypothetical protein